MFYISLKQIILFLSPLFQREEEIECLSSLLLIKSRLGHFMTENRCFESTLMFIHDTMQFKSDLCSYLVDPASSHMLVLKIKPCMSKYKNLYLRNCEWLIKSVIIYLMVFPLGYQW